GAAGMTGFLASVTSADEAEIVLAAGADIIDLKDPHSGALGALPAPAIREAVRKVAGRGTVSATAGDLPMHPQVIVDAVDRIAALGVDIVKIGMFAGGDRLACIAALAKQAARGTRIVAVLFADQAPDFALIDRLQAAAFAGISPTPSSAISSSACRAVACSAAWPVPLASPISRHWRGTLRTTWVFAAPCARTAARRD